MMSNSSRSHIEKRPRFMASLGLSPPYAMEDVEEAYRILVLKTHPDQGGSPDDFKIIQSAYERVTEYVRFRSNKREWIAEHVEAYSNVQNAANKFRSLGAEVEVTAAQWLQQSFGDFAELSAVILGICLRDYFRAETLIDYMIEEKANLRRLRSLDLSGCILSDSVLGKVRQFSVLVELNLSRTSAGAGIANLVGNLPSLMYVNLAGTKVGWLDRSRIKRILSARRKERPIVFTDTE